MGEDVGAWRQVTGQPLGLVLARPSGAAWSDDDRRNWRHRVFQANADAIGKFKAWPYDLRHAEARKGSGLRLMDAQRTQTTMRRRRRRPWFGSGPRKPTRGLEPRTPSLRESEEAVPPCSVSFGTPLRSADLVPPASATFAEGVHPQVHPSAIRRVRLPQREGRASKRGRSGLPRRVQRPRPLSCCRRGA
jgi:hypothetical protein